MATTTDGAGREADLIRAAKELVAADWARDFTGELAGGLGADHARYLAEAEADVGVCIARLRAALATYDGGAEHD